MTLQQLEYIVALARYRQFAKAADACNVTQPTLSSMVQKLENELGALLFDRKATPITPTPIGRLVIEEAWRTLRRAQRITDVVLEQQQTMQGTLRIAILPTIAPYLIPRFFPQMMKRYSTLDMSVTEMKTADMARALLHYDIDIAIAARHDELEKFNATPLFTEKYYAYVARENKLYNNKHIRIADLNGTDMWLLDEGHCFRDQLVSFCKLKAAQTAQRAYSLGSIETFMRMVESGDGITFIPELATLQLNEQQKQLVRPFALPVPSREILIFAGKNFVRKTLLNTLVDEIRAAVPEEMLAQRPDTATVR